MLVISALPSMSGEPPILPLLRDLGLSGLKPLANRPLTFKRHGKQKGAVIVHTALLDECGQLLSKGQLRRRFDAAHALAGAAKAASQFRDLRAEAGTDKADAAADIRPDEVILRKRSAIAEKKKGSGLIRNPCIAMVGREGFEPSTKRLKVTGQLHYFQCVTPLFVPLQSSKLTLESLGPQRPREFCGTDFQPIQRPQRGLSHPTKWRILACLGQPVAPNLFLPGPDQGHVLAQPRLVPDHPLFGAGPALRVAAAPAERSSRAVPVPVQRGNPDAIVHPFSHGHHPHPMAGDHSRGVIRVAGRPSRPVEVGGERHGREDTAGRRTD
ncbi:hypothetical protein [Stenotrophomonas sp. NY11291]|uniref:hypothetical protein n=1 Tax=Stenotrophomonas sp. NY11291 TaxID=2939415 RepID=UPI00200FF93D|nr:hypothetical protein [Stenotrophomonas sp. NY11291]UQA21491.1 hypothetical protein M1L61_17160 [Stenotrophomonas sp. NY11291]